MTITVFDQSCQLDIVTYPVNRVTHVSLFVIMEKIIKLAQKNYDFGLQDYLVNPYFHDLSSKVNETFIFIKLIEIMWK